MYIDAKGGLTWGRKPNKMGNMGYNLGMTGVVGSGVSNDGAFPRPFDGGTSAFMHLISDSLQIYP